MTNGFRKKGDKRIQLAMIGRSTSSTTRPEPHGRLRQTSYSANASEEGLTRLFLLRFLNDDMCRSVVAGWLFAYSEFTNSPDLELR